MRKEKEKAMYESPVTKKTPVNLESGICSSSIMEKDSSKVKATQQEYVEYDFSDQNTWSDWSANN